MEVQLDMERIIVGGDLNVELTKYLANEMTFKLTELN